MRDDFNKLLTERERRGSTSRFGEVRHDKHFAPDEVAGRESMKKRYDAYGDRKDFNENLNPLIKFLRGQVGRPWNKIYSEITKTFDKRKVINDHILQHLFQYVETKDIYVEDGELWLRSRWKAPVRIKDHTEYRDSYYVDPRDGIMKKFKTETSRQRSRKSTQAAKIEKAKVLRTLDDGSELRLIDGAWYHFEWSNVPERIIGFHCPTSMTQFNFSKLSKEEQAKHGLPHTANFVTCALTGELIDPDPRKLKARDYYRYGKFEGVRVVVNGKYRSTKKSASHKLLKKAGLV